MTDTQPASCMCVVCQEYRDFCGNLNKMPAVYRSQFMELYDKYVMADMDRDYYKAIVFGLWPSCDDVIRACRAKQRQSTPKESLGE